MKKLLLTILFTLVLSGGAFADPKNPTKEWLKDQTVNTLTQKHGYTLKFVTMTTEEDMQYTNYILTRLKNSVDGGQIIVTCSYRGINFGHHCFLP